MACSYYMDGSGFSASVFTDTVAAGSVRTTSGLVGAISSEHEWDTEPNATLEGIWGVGFSGASEIAAPSTLITALNESGLDLTYSICVFR